jgi:ribosome biogenesis GTPase
LCVLRANALAPLRALPVTKETLVFRLKALGWSSFFESQIDPVDDAGFAPARVAEEQRGSYRILAESGLHYAELSGRLRHEIELEEALRPCVGDWVLARIQGGDAGSGTVLIHRVLARRTHFSRKEAGERTVEQVIAANIDTVFLVQSLNRDLNPRRVERYLALLWESGAEPVVILSKSDLCHDPETAVGLVEGVARGVQVHVVSAVSPGGLDRLKPYLRAGRTAALVGSSGVGKSTIVNRLLGHAEMRVQEIREDDDRGRHTTTARHLVLLPEGGMLIDTPGMRTVLMWEGEEGLSQTFQDIEDLASACKFRDCSHESEPGCAVRDALESGTLDRGRWSSYTKLQREVRYEASKTDVKLRLAETERWRRIHREARRRPDKRRFS